MVLTAVLSGVPYPPDGDLWLNYLLILQRGFVPPLELNRFENLALNDFD